MTTELTNTAALEADFSHAVTMQTRELRLKTRAAKAGNYGAARQHQSEAAKWALAAWSIASSLDRFRVAKLAAAARAAA